LARIRTIKPKLWDSEKLGRLSVLSRLNFIGLISLADDEGRGRGEIRYLVGHLHPYSKDVTEKEFGSAIQHLKSAEFVAFYDVDGCTYYALPGWREHQYIEKPKPSDIPPVPESHPMYPLFVGDLEGNHSPINHGRIRKGMEGNGMDGITTAGNPPKAVDLTRIRFPYGKHRGVCICNLPVDECQLYLKDSRLGKDLRAALIARIEYKHGEMSPAQKRARGIS